MRPLRFRSGPDARAAAPPRTADTLTLWRAPWPRTPAPEASRTLATAVLRHGLGLAAAEASLQRSPHGRLQLPEAGGIDLSISHSAGWWLMAVAPGRRRVGVDIEPLRDRPRALALAERHFPPEEVAALARLAPGARSRAFLRLWCAREAILKAHGRGIAFGLERLQLAWTPDRLRLVACDPELGAVSDWRLREIRPAPGLLGVLAWRGPPARVRAFDASGLDEGPA